MRILRVSLAAVIALMALVSSARAQFSPQHEGQRGGVYSGDLASDPETLARLSALTGPAPCAGGRAAGTFACEGIDLRSFVPLEDLVPGSRSVSNLWGFVDLDDRREYAVVGANNGTAVVEVSDSARPRVVGSVPGAASIWREVKIYQLWNPTRRRHDAWAYVVTEGAGAGLQILDLSDLPASVSLAATYRGFETAHTLFLANVDPATGAPNVADVAPVLYINGSDQGCLALDVSNPTAPSIAGRLLNTYVHDSWAGVFRGNRAGPCARGPETCEILVDWGGDAVRIVDFTTKSDPVLISAFTYPEIGYAHSGWISRDGNYIFSFDEVDELDLGGKSRIRVIDISDLFRPFLAGVWTSTTDAIEHNGYAVGDKLYVSYYERGIAVLDVTQPTTPREIGFFDTFPASDAALFHGAWGVYPYLPSGTIVVSNIDGAGGLFVLKESTASLAPPPEVPRDRIEAVPRPRDTRALPRFR